MAEDYKGKIDFAIITIREDENRAVLKRFPTDEIYRGTHRSYAICRVLLTDGGYYLVAIIRSIEQGEGHGQDVARDLVEDLDPRWILLVGIAGGVPAAEFTLGDVVAAVRLTDFSVKAALQGRDSQYAVSGGPMHKKVQDILALLPAMTSKLGDWNSESSIGMAKPKVTLTATNFYGSDDWKAKTKAMLTRHFGRSASLRPPLVTTGVVASSDTLMKDTNTLQQWQEAARQLNAIEMELGGVYIAARRPEKEYPVVAIRGISDIVGFKRHPDWTEYACQSAAAFTFALIRTGHLTIYEKPGFPGTVSSHATFSDTTTSPASVAAAHSVSIGGVVSRPTFKQQVQRIRSMSVQLNEELRLYLPDGEHDEEDEQYYDYLIGQVSAFAYSVLSFLREYAQDTKWPEDLQLEIDSTDHQPFVLARRSIGMFEAFVSDCGPELTN